MGEVAVVYKVMPEGLEVDLSVVKGHVEERGGKYGKVHQVEEKPVAFGLKALMVTIIMEDKTAKPDELEQELESIEGVQSVNTENLTLI